MFMQSGELVAGETLFYGPGFMHNEAESVACRVLHTKLADIM